MEKTIKKITRLGLGLLLTLTLTLSSCKKEEPIPLPTYCAECVEATTNTLTSYCGVEDSVDIFISDLKTMGVASGEDWSCVKNKN